MTRSATVTAAGALLFLALGNPAAAQQFYEYAAKIICGRPDSSLVTLAPQTYATTINVRVPTVSRTAIIAKRLAFTVPPGHQRRGEVREIAVDTLREGEALVVDCLDLAGRKVGTSFEGFLVLKSTVSLDVTAVYSVPGGIDVEQIRERVIRPVVQ